MRRWLRQLTYTNVMVTILGFIVPRVRLQPHTLSAVRRNRVAAGLGLAACLGALVVMTAGAQVRRHGATRDLPVRKLAAYLDLRFSSAVPSGVIERVLAAEHFSGRDLRLVRATAPAKGDGARSLAPQSATSASAAASGAARRIREISRDRLPCPSSDPGCQHDTQAEADIAANPARPRNLVATFQQGRYADGGSVDPGWAASFDGGRTWRHRGNIPGLTVGVTSASGSAPGLPFDRGSDPVVAFDRKHRRVYLNTLAISDAGCFQQCDSAVAVNISKNGGKSFGRPRVVHEDVNDPGGSDFVFNDKNWIVVDNHRRSPHFGRAYVVWDQVRCINCGATEGEEKSGATIEQPLMLSYSDDAGRTWHKPIQVTHPPASHGNGGVEPGVLPDGHLVLVYSDYTSGRYSHPGTFQAVRSRDGGRHWSHPVTVASAQPFVEEDAGIRGGNLPSVTASGRRIYVAFQDERFASGRNDILLTSSRDEGRTWREPINATPGEEDLDHFTPDVAVRRGAVHLTYRTRKPGQLADAPTVNVAYRKLRHGRTVRGPVNLGRPSNANLAAFTSLGKTTFRFFGDYAGIALSRHSAHPIWEQANNFKNAHDNPTGTHQRSFSATVGHARKRGGSRRANGSAVQGGA